MHSNIKTGALVNVESLATGEATSYGKVVSVGSRIVAMPDRLANNLGQISYGREIIVEIPSNTQLLLGEKVQISPRSRILSAFVAMASSKENKNSIEEPQLFTVPAALSERSSFESSGAIYLADLNKYLIVSDDTDNLDTPWMFYSSPEGEIDDEPVQIPGVKEIIDMESISSDGNYIYVMSSLKSSKKGKSKTERNLLVQLERKGFDFQHIKTINIGKILREKLSTSNNEILKSFRNQDLNNLEVEGHAVKNNTLYIAIKSPLTSEGRSLIVALPKLNSDMPGDLNVIANVAFNHKKEQQISDFVFSGEQIFIATTCVDGSKCGALWEAKEKNSAYPISNSIL